MPVRNVSKEGAVGLVNNSARQNMADLRAMANDLIWFQYGKGDGPAAHAYASSTSTTVSGADVTAAYHAGRRVKAVGSSTGTIYGSVASSSFSTNTVVNYTWDSGSLANETLTIYLSQVPVTGKPINVSSVSGISATLPTRQVLISGTGATYTTPTGCRQLRIRMVGGGGGGQGVAASAFAGSGVAGNDTLFNSIVAKGGSGGTAAAAAGGSGGAGTASFRVSGGGACGGTGYANPNPTDTQQSGYCGGSSAFGGAGACSIHQPGQSAATNSGSGGGGGTYADVAAGPGYQTCGGGGAAGEYVEIIVNSPASSYLYTVGSGGGGGSGTFVGGNGAAGIIIVDELY